MNYVKKVIFGLYLLVFLSFTTIVFAENVEETSFLNK